MKYIIRTALFSAIAMGFFAHAQPLTFSLNRLQDGKSIKVTEKSFDDKYLLIGVGFTSCPDVCPTTMLDMRNMLITLDATPEIAQRLQPLFLTIDPTSDTLKNITDYAAFFDKRIIGLRADDFKILDKVVEKLHASYGYIFDRKPVFPPELPKGYTVMHSIHMYLYSPDGKLLDVFPYNEGGKSLAKKITSYIKRGQSDSKLDVSKKTDVNKKLDTKEKPTTNKLEPQTKTCKLPKPFKQLGATRAKDFLEHDALKYDRTKKPQLINLWATWCKPCRKELPYLQQLSEKNQANIKLINIEDEPKDVEKVLDELKVTLKTDYVKMEVLDELGIQGLPASVVFNKDKVYLGIGVLKEEAHINTWLNCLNNQH